MLAPRAAWRRAIVPDTDGMDTRDGPSRGISDPGVTTEPAGRAPNRTWAELMQRSFGFDVLACPRCAGRLTLVALIHNPAVIRRILEHLGLPVERPAFLPARDPPLVFEAAGEDSTWPN